MRVLRCAWLVSERFLGCCMSSVFCDFSPTHSPNPSLAPPGERGGLHLAVCLKVGNLVIERVFSSKWVQGSHEALKSISALRQQTAKCLQPIENPPIQFDGNVPLRTFFPPCKTRPNVAVSSLSAPAGVERVGVRGGIQRLKNKGATNSRVEGSSHADRIALDPCKRDPKNA